jgi:hypothetical protein
MACDLPGGLQLQNGIRANLPGLVLSVEIDQQWVKVCDPAHKTVHQRFVVAIARADNGVAHRYEVGERAAASAQHALILTTGLHPVVDLDDENVVRGSCRVRELVADAQ